MSKNPNSGVKPPKEDSAQDSVAEPFVVQAGDGVPAQFAFEVMPEPTYLDRTKGDRDRLMQRVRPQLTKDHIKDLMRRGGSILGSYAVANAMRTMFVDDNQMMVPAVADSVTPEASLPVGVGEPR